MQIMYNKKHLTILLKRRGPHTDTHPKETDPVGSLLKASSSRKGELEARACAWTCPPRVVFDDLAQWRDSNSQLSRGVKDEGTRSGAADASTIRTAKTSEEAARQAKQVILLRLRHTTRLRRQHEHEHEPEPEHPSKGSLVFLSTP